MITLAAVTMIFLPGTYVSAFLSTTMFEYGHESVQVSQQWWILVITTVVFTAVILGVWYGWQIWWVPNHPDPESVGDEEEQRSQ